MKIRKMSFREGQVWLSIESEDGEYIGTLHSQNLAFIKTMQESINKQLSLKIVEGENK